MTFGPCCVGECCAPGSYCCQNAGPHDHEPAELADRLFGAETRDAPPPRGSNGYLWSDREWSELVEIRRSFGLPEID